MTPVGVGLVGFGMAAQSLHAPLIGAEPGLALRAVVSSDPAKVHRDLPAVPVVSTVDDLLADAAVELVVVAAPTAVHAEVAAAALRAGRHVVVDKPLAVTVAEADELIGLAAAAGRQLAAFHQRRWDSDHLSLARCIRSGQLGEVATYLARYDRFRPEVVDRWRERPGPGAGLLYDLGSHLVDQALRLFGPPATVWADIGVQRPGGTVDDYFHLVLGYGPRRAILHAGSLVLAPGPRLEVHGDAGSVVWDGMDGQVAALLDGQRPGDPGWGETGGAGTLTTVDGARPVERVPGAYETFYRQMAAAVRGEAPVPVPAEQARDVLRVVECARRSSAEGRRLLLGAPVSSPRGRADRTAVRAGRGSRAEHGGDDPRRPHVDRPAGTRHRRRPALGAVDRPHGAAADPAAAGRIASASFPVGLRCAGRGRARPVDHAVRHRAEPGRRGAGPADPRARAALGRGRAPVAADHRRSTDPGPGRRRPGRAGRGRADLAEPAQPGRLGQPGQ